MRQHLNWLRSAEGPFSLKPLWVKRSIKNSANLLGIPLYLLPEWQRTVMGQFVARHKEECLFLVYRIDFELEVVSARLGVKNTYTEYALQRLFGAEGLEDINKYFYEYSNDKDAIDTAQIKALTLGSFTLRDSSKLQASPDFKAGLAWAEKLSGMPGNISQLTELESANLGLHTKYFSHIFLTEEYGKWCDTHVMARHALKALEQMYRNRF